MRMHIRRLTRLTNAFSKKWENLKAVLALHFAWYNFCRIHKSLRVTPTMEAGITNHIWSMEELIGEATHNQDTTQAHPSLTQKFLVGYSLPEGRDDRSAFPSDGCLSALKAGFCICSLREILGLAGPASE